MADLTTRTLGDTSKGTPLTNEEVDQNFINLRDDPRNSDSREWTGVTVSQAEAEAGTGATRRAWTAQRIKQAIVSAISTIQNKLNGIEDNATKNVTDAQLRDRTTHTGTQSVATVTGLSDSATTAVSTIRAGVTKANVGLSDVDNYSRASYDARYLAVGAKAVDSDELDGLNSSQFLRSDTGTVPLTRLPATALIGDTTYTGGTGLTLSGTTFNIDAPFNPSGDYALLRAQATTKGDVGLDNVRNVDAYSKAESNSNYATASQGTLADNAEPKETGKGLSRNDYTDTEKSKLTGIASSATNNDTNAQLRARSSHTGTQAVSTITGLADSATTTVSTIRAGTTKANVGLNSVDDFSRAHYDGRYLALGGKAADASTLDGLNSTQFLRSDTNDTMSGRLNIGGSDDGVNQLQVDGDTALRGNVGVNTDDPTYALDVAGDVRLRDENSVLFGGAGASDAKFGMRYNAATQSLDFNYLG